MDFKEAMKYMKEVEQYGSVLGLDNTAELLKRLDNPQDRLKFIHVAGTNGKGSVSAYLSNILTEAGYLAGRYVSPVIFHYCERIQICEKNGSTAYIQEEEAAGYIGRIKNVIDQMTLEGMPHPTPFEIETAMAFLYFTDKKCDIVVLEVGMGGRLDSTNVVNTVVCSVITSISMDHMQILGESLSQIAYEKAGIIKYEVPVVSYEQRTEAMEVIKKEAERKNAVLTVMSLEQILNVNHSFEEITFDYAGFKDLKLRQLGENQVKNAALAIETVIVLNQQGYNLSEAEIRNGLKITRWPGRFELIHKHPFLFIDGAHNEDAARSLAESIDIYFTDQNILFIMGVFADKDYRSILRETASRAECIITITPPSARALPSMDLADAARQYCENVIDGGTIENAVAIAMTLAKKEDIILAFGSLSFLGSLSCIAKNLP